MRRSISFSLVLAVAALSAGVAVAADRTAGAGVPSLAAAISPLRINGVVGPCLCPTCTRLRTNLDESARTMPVQHAGGVAAV